MEYAVIVDEIYSTWVDVFESRYPDALDLLLANANEDVAISFEYEGYTIRIRGDGQLTFNA